MRTNGYLQIQKQELPTFDIHGVPMATYEDQWGESISCNIKTNSHSNKGTYQDGKFTTAKYEILTELSDISAKRVKLVLNGSDLGDFAVQDIQKLSSVGRTKIIV